ncbi:MAG: ribosomal protein L11 methyltransferase [Oligoflexia bacterium]|nr:MAG: ribosomal protein L11 methyltransferase [Oligoflexia bacterium]
MSLYFRLRLFSVPTWREEEMTQFCMQAGATGISEALAYVQPDLTYDPSIVPVKSHDLDIYFLEKPSDEFLKNLETNFPQARFQVFEEENKDWLAEWKKGFEPFKLVGPYWVVPSWFDSPVAPEHTIKIDPGMAFGTGTHATTKMASYFVHKICTKLSHLENLSLIDVGTGTAILAMLAKLHGVGTVVGVEIDPEARRVARENIKLNNLNEITVPDLLIEEVDETYDIVVANIIDGVLVEIKPHLLNVLKPGGHLFLTGILVEREDGFMERFMADTNLKVIRRIEEDEWVGYWLQS